MKLKNVAISFIHEGADPQFNPLKAQSECSKMILQVLLYVLYFYFILFCF